MAGNGPDLTDEYGDEEGEDDLDGDADGDGDHDDVDDDDDDEEESEGGYGQKRAKQWNWDSCAYKSSIESDTLKKEKRFQVNQALNLKSKLWDKYRQTEFEVTRAGRDRLTQAPNRAVLFEIDNVCSLQASSD